MQMHPALTAPSTTTVPAFPFSASGTQFLAVSGHITDRLFVTYRAKAQRLASLVPPPFTLDVYRGYGFLSVCAVEILKMRIGRAPKWCSFDNREFLYRLGVRLRGDPTFITLRSDVSSRALSILGRYFSHYRPSSARVSIRRDAGRIRMECAAESAFADAVLEVDPQHEVTRRTSVFSNEEEATQFLLGMTFSADAVRERVRIQPIHHSPWSPRFVSVREARFAFIDDLARRLGVSFEYDSTLATRDVQQVWQAARWL